MSAASALIAVLGVCCSDPSPPTRQPVLSVGDAVNRLSRSGLQTNQVWWAKGWQGDLSDVQLDLPVSALADLPSQWARSGEFTQLLQVLATLGKTAPEALVEWLDASSNQGADRDAGATLIRDGFEGSTSGVRFVASAQVGFYYFSPSGDLFGRLLATMNRESIRRLVRSELHAAVCRAHVLNPLIVAVCSWPESAGSTLAQEVIESSTAPKVSKLCALAHMPRLADPPLACLQAIAGEPDLELASLAAAALSRLGHHGMAERIADGLERGFLSGDDSRMALLLGARSHLRDVWPPAEHLASETMERLRSRKVGPSPGFVLRHIENGVEIPVDQPPPDILALTAQEVQAYKDLESQVVHWIRHARR